MLAGLFVVLMVFLVFRKRLAAQRYPFFACTLAFKGKKAMQAVVDEARAGVNRMTAVLRLRYESFKDCRSYLRKISLQLSLTPESVSRLPASPLFF